MRILGIITAIGLAVATLFLVAMALVCLELAFHGYWPANWASWYKAMNMNHVAPHEYLQGLNATCVVILILITASTVRITVDIFGRIRR